MFKKFPTFFLRLCVLRIASTPMKNLGKLYVEVDNERIFCKKN